MSFPLVRPNRMALAVVALSTALALSACGDEELVTPTASDPSSATTSASPTETSETPEAAEPTETPTIEKGTTPECSQVWVDQQIMPIGYRACAQDGETIKPVKHKCGFGATLLTHDDRFFAIQGLPITDAEDLETSEQFQQLLSSCQA